MPLSHFSCVAQPMITEAHRPHFLALCFVRLRRRQAQCCWRWFLGGRAQYCHSEAIETDQQNSSRVSLYSPEDWSNFLLAVLANIPLEQTAARRRIRSLRGSKSEPDVLDLSPQTDLASSNRRV
jgi:hypothetical protein